MSISSTAVIVSLFVLTGCATAYQPPPLTMQHPAHPEAIVAPGLPPSTTLAYGPADRPAPQPASHVAQRQQQPGRHDPQPAAQDSQHTVVGEGTVIAVVPSGNQVVLDHKEIKGFMDAMTMGYRIEPPSLLEGVHTGEVVRFTIDTQQKTIIKLEKLQP